MNQSFIRRNFINQKLTVFKVRGDCSFVVEVAGARILWELTEAHQKTALSKTQKSSQSLDKCTLRIEEFYCFACA